MLLILIFITAFTYQVWPEVTDPEKFVFEDVAIATYLLVSVKLLLKCTQTSWHRPVGQAYFYSWWAECRSINLRVKHVSDPTEINWCDRQVKLQQQLSHRHFHWHDLDVLQWFGYWICVSAVAGAVGGGAHRKKSDGQTVLRGPGLWEWPPRPHPVQWRSKLDAAGWTLVKRFNKLLFFLVKY